MKCPNCGLENKETDASCNLCATVLMRVEVDPATKGTVICPKCGHENIKGIISCNSCCAAISTTELPKSAPPSQGAPPQSASSQNEPSQKSNLLVFVGIAVILLGALGWWLWSGKKTAVETKDVEASKLIAQGTNYDINGNLAKGKVTVVEFFADW